MLQTDAKYKAVINWGVGYYDSQGLFQTKRFGDDFINLAKEIEFLVPEYVESSAYKLMSCSLALLAMLIFI